ncbi:sigma-70 family RNA polymerase sigma factor [Acidiferrimicrobium sp. IK]|uniref:sigma-70 family RNA polymerase sigma factor n=1 Tax=Acidiferrimicrobium sp. IK TaxID=2871700 RepID=UPI0021CB92B3|nr:sigma-70 family RNA polymerase sigma factor [Acidiferrimicrobium sp. IK]MCU4185534.1 sigma-70 family RNA polymerase sigma factor [Acidiferrimicrobium sp. IK]
MGKARSEAGEQDLVRLYLDGIGQYPLLTKDDEVRLSQLMEAGRAAAAALDSGEKLTAAKKRELRRVRGEGAAATEEFVNANLRLVVSIAKKYQSADMPLLDLIQEGNLGLIHAVEKFDWRKGFKFSTYATWWIRQAIGRGIDNTSRTIRLPVHAGDQIRRLLRMRGQMEGELGRSPTPAELSEAMQMPEEQITELLQYGAEPVSLEAPIGTDGDTELADIVADMAAPSPFDVVANAMLGGEIDKLLAPLDEREREILRLRYGLDRGDPRTLEEVGAVLQLTRERIRQIERTALSKLRHPSADTGAHDLLAS